MDSLETLPPPYTANPPDEIPAGPELHSLTLTHTQIHPALPSASPLYELTHPLTDAARPLYGLQKIRYCRSPRGRITPRPCHIYDIQNLAGDRASIGGQRPQSTTHTMTHAHVRLERRLRGWGAVEAVGHFVAEPVKRKRGQMAWKDLSGRLVAVETRHGRNVATGKVRTAPQLELKTVLEEKDLDLLVACWMARVWKQSCSELRSRISVTDCKFPLVLL